MTDGGANAGGKGDWIGRLLKGRYRVERTLGSGGMGSVYLAHDDDLHRAVVVKVPHARLLDDEQFRARFAKEIRSLTSLPHPHVVKVLDAGEASDDTRAAGAPPTPFAVLEFLEGGSLKDKLEQTLQSPEEVLGWLPDVAKALDFIHGQGVVHRDIKPGNVLFDRTGNAVVADFGIAKALGTMDTGLTRTGFTPGSPPYMGPEVGMGLPLGPGYDEYALGVLVYEALSGALPHEGTSGEVLIAKKAYVEPIDLGAKAPNVPPAARAAVMKAIARKPEDRFPSCRAFAEAFVQGVRAPAPSIPQAAPPSPPPKFPVDAHRPARGPVPEPERAGAPSSRRRTVLAIAVLSILTVGAFFALRRPSESGPETSRRDPTTESPGGRASAVPTPPPSAERIEAVYAAFLKGFAVAVGSEIDATTGYPKKIRRLKDDGEMVLIPAGTFQMGAVPGDSNASTDEKPRHAVTLSKAYYLDVNEVTVGQWKKFVAGGGGRLPTDLRSEATDRHPIHEVEHTEMTAFATWAGGTLPTEAQWERAAKGGHDDFVYPWGASDDVKKRNGIGSEDGFNGLAPVRSYAANDYGLYDMSGNVWEWCSDWYDSSYYAASPSREPAGPGSGSARAARGGSWSYGDDYLRASYRDYYDPSKRGGYLGFRLARSL